MKDFCFRVLIVGLFSGIVFLSGCKGSGVGLLDVYLVTPANQEVFLDITILEMAMGDDSKYETYQFDVANVGSFLLQADGVPTDETLPLVLRGYDLSQNIVARGKSIPIELTTDLNNLTYVYFSRIGEFGVLPSAMTRTRYGHSATNIGNLGVLLAGGNDGTTTITGVEFYNRYSLQFMAEVQLIKAREGHIAFPYLENQALLCFGQAQTGETTTILNDCELYSLDGNTVSATEFILDPARYSPSVMPLDTRYVISGGMGTDGAISDILFYDPTTGAFSSAAVSLLHSRVGHRSVTLSDGRIAFVGGLSGDYPDPTAIPLVEIYNPVVDQIEAVLSDFPYPNIKGHLAYLLDINKIVLIGGENNGTILSSAIILDLSCVAPEAEEAAEEPACEQITVIDGFLPIPLSQAEGNRLQTGQFFIGAGLTENSLPSNQAFIIAYDAETEALSILASKTMSLPRFGARLEPVGDQTLLICGGMGSTGISNSCEAYNP